MPAKHPTPPTVTEEGRALGRERALAARRERAEIKKRLKAGDLKPVDALKMPAVQRMHVYEFLKALPGVGYPTARKIMERCFISEKKRVEGLGSRQQMALIDYLGEVFR